MDPFLGSMQLRIFHSPNAQVPPLATRICEDGTRVAGDLEEDVPSSFQAVTVIAIALLPGALYVWAFERQVGRYGIGLNDRILRFVGGSAVLLAILSGPIYALHVTFTDEFLAGRPLPWWLMLVPMLYVGVPLAAGTSVGLGLRRGWKVAKLLSGPDPAPRAWDYLFQYNVDGWIRCRLKSGSWIAGAYADANGRRSYAAGYPEPQDLYLAASVEVDPRTGEFELGAHGQPQQDGGGLLLRWEEVEYLEFIDA